ncbi:ATP-dependent zinc protease [Candidatus Sulfurimonas marisnigri]|uniref:ATP-dependent zinc protease n=1 Tax=Candidatus Sulfurimonas marisnigri TaxID=2740405 RepID=A0A7S7LY21_9BACT|nr:RimK/LysX family protein [Candidatus Sulfurimonas marisnigri]QOY53536.1 ATP-dependent zinc protease [Candidatus Sulfurimonas marisnigri]
MIKKKIIGKKELISILDLELYGLDAKVDTGADSNALHCDDIFVDENNIVHFKLLDEVHEAYNGKHMQVPLYKMKKIRSSNGKLQHRPSIKVEIELLGEKYSTIISLTDRSDMKYPMLIGRKFLDGKFLVDVSLEYLAKQI